MTRWIRSSAAPGVALALLGLGCSASSSGAPSANEMRDAGGGEAASSSATFERPISLVFKVHIEPQSTLSMYERRRDDVEAVRTLAKRYGVPLTIHGNGEFFQYAREQGDTALVQSWIDDGNDVGPHMHSVYNERDGEHAWTNAKANQTSDPSFVAALWQDHIRELALLLPAHKPNQATPYDSADSTFASRMAAAGFTIAGGGREEIAENWLGHHPFHPFRIGARYLEEDLSSPVVLVSHYAQFGEADTHGPDGAFADQTLAHHQVGFLLLYLNWLHAERTGEPTDRVWEYGFLTHDNKSSAAVRASLETWLSWVTTHFGGEKKSLRGNTILKPSTLSTVYRDYLDWERGHPNTSSFHVATPVTTSPSTVTREQRRAMYPGPLWGLSEALRADVDTVVDHVSVVTAFDKQGVSCHELSYGPRSDTSRRFKRWVLWKESDGAATIDATTLTGRDKLRSWNPMTGEASELVTNSLVIGSLPVVVDEGSP